MYELRIRCDLGILDPRGFEFRVPGPENVEAVLLLGKIGHLYADTLYDLLMSGF